MYLMKVYEKKKKKKCAFICKFLFPTFATWQKVKPRKNP